MKPDRKVAVIAGAGPAGLTAALELLRRSGIMPVVFEADGQVGGISKTVNYRGNRMDLGGHRFFSKSDWVMGWWQDILPLAEDPSEAGTTLRIAYRGQERELVPKVGSSTPSDAVSSTIRSRSTPTPSKTWASSRPCGRA
jgi:protoporphyrinogen oxidase